MCCLPRGRGRRACFLVPVNRDNVAQPRAATQGSGDAEISTAGGEDERGSSAATEVLFAGTGSRRCWNQRPVLLQSTAPGGEDGDVRCCYQIVFLLEPGGKKLQPLSIGDATGWRRDGFCWNRHNFLLEPASIFVGGTVKTFAVAGSTVLLLLDSMIFFFCCNRHVFLLLPPN